MCIRHWQYMDDELSDTRWRRMSLATSHPDTETSGTPLTLAKRRWLALHPWPFHLQIQSPLTQTEEEGQLQVPENLNPRHSSLEPQWHQIQENDLHHVPDNFIPNKEPSGTPLTLEGDGQFYVWHLVCRWKSLLSWNRSRFKQVHE
jgi:hypothetical protein